MVKKLKDLGFYFYDLVLMFEIYLGNGLNLPISTVHITVDYKDP